MTSTRSYFFPVSAEALSFSSPVSPSTTATVISLSSVLIEASLNDPPERSFFMYCLSGSFLYLTEKSDLMTVSARPPEISESAADELYPSIGGSACSESVFETSIPYSLISLPSSLTVSTESISLIPFRIMPSRLASNFIAVHGVTETENIFSGFKPA